MPENRKYEPIPPLDRKAVEAAIGRNDPEELLHAVLSAALHADDPAWAQEICLRLASHENFNVRGNAVLGFGHLARLHQALDPARVQPVIEKALRDPHAYVRGQAQTAVDDIQHYMHWRIQPPASTDANPSGG